MSTKNELLKIEIDGKEINIQRERYAKAKTKDLRKFGYNGLKLEEVEDQISKVIAGDENLTVIGMFMKDEIKTRQKRKRSK